MRQSLSHGTINKLGQDNLDKVRGVAAGPPANAPQMFGAEMSGLSY